MTSIRSYLKRLVNLGSYITVVSGLPRSGTSMMMSALKVGGMPLLVDGERVADANNPKGYFEFERVKQLPSGDHAWLKGARGKAVKIISALIEYLPSDYHYRVIFMRRNMSEILTSQQKMLDRQGQLSSTEMAREALTEGYAEHLKAVMAFLDQSAYLETLFVSYNDILRAPKLVFGSVAKFLDRRVNAEAMASIVDRRLYRARE